MLKLDNFLSKKEMEQLRRNRRGRAEERHSIVTRLLIDKFGAPPAWVKPKVQAIQSDEDVRAFLRRLQTATRLEEVFAPDA